MRTLSGLAAQFVCKLNFILVKLNYHFFILDFFAGFLFPPYFDYYRPDYMNYAILGTFIGHEMTHHFDERGSRGGGSYFANYSSSLWSSKTQKWVDQKLNCFIKQYSQITDEVTGKKVSQYFLFFYFFRIF